MAMGVLPLERPANQPLSLGLWPRPDPLRLCPPSRRQLLCRKKLPDPDPCLSPLRRHQHHFQRPFCLLFRWGAISIAIATSLSAFLNLAFSHTRLLPIFLEFLLQNDPCLGLPCSSNPRRLFWNGSISSAFPQQLFQLLYSARSI